ncbi:MAG TPA: hypothetical protein VFV68_08295, partial [Agriterribacter sp.]|nr:hypothetical protein [Agriterribacter sp.]
MRNVAPGFIVFALLFFCSCKKENNNNTTPDDRIKDTAWAYAKDIYLWNKNLPSSFNARSYADPDAIMKALRPYSHEPGFAEPVDRWSFGIKKSEWNDVSSGISGDFGFSIFFKSENDLRVSYVEPESPAAAAGIARSWRIIAVNGNTTVNTDDATISRISDAVFKSSSGSFTFKKPDSTEVDINLAAASYQDTP